MRSIVIIVLYVALICIGLAIAMKRCHDRNRSGWFVLLSFVSIPNIWCIVEIGFLRGTSGSNAYGAEPLPAKQVRGARPTVAWLPGEAYAIVRCMGYISLVTLCCALLAPIPAAEARDYTVGSIEISQPWSRATPATAPSAGGFLTLTNKGSAPDRLIAVQSPAARQVEVHEMKMDGAVMRMRELSDGLALPPGQTVELKPGGYHVMFIGLKAPFAKDQRVPATLVFEKAGRVDVEFTVEALGATQPSTAKP
jgi:periplasmic copper chaperone A